MRAEGFTPAEHYIAGDILTMGSVEKNPDGSYSSWVEA